MGMYSTQSAVYCGSPASVPLESVECGETAASAYTVYPYLSCYPSYSLSPENGCGCPRRGPGVPSTHLCPYNVPPSTGPYTSPAACSFVSSAPSPSFAPSLLATSYATVPAPGSLLPSAPSYREHRAVRQPVQYESEDFITDRVQYVADRTHHFADRTQYLADPTQYLADPTQYLADRAYAKVNEEQAILPFEGSDKNFREDPPICSFLPALARNGRTEARTHTPPITYSSAIASTATLRGSSSMLLTETSTRATYPNFSYIQVNPSSPQILIPINVITRQDSPPGPQELVPISTTGMSPFTILRIKALIELSSISEDYPYHVYTKCKRDEAPSRLKRRGSAGVSPVGGSAAVENQGTTGVPNSWWTDQLNQLLTRQNQVDRKQVLNKVNSQFDDEKCTAEDEPLKPTRLCFNPGAALICFDPNEKPRRMKEKHKKNYNNFLQQVTAK